MNIFLLVTRSPDFLNLVNSSPEFCANASISGEQTGIRRVRKHHQAPEVPAEKPPLDAAFRPLLSAFCKIVSANRTALDSDDRIDRGRGTGVRNFSEACHFGIH